MLFYHQIHYIFMINAVLSQNFVVPIYALFPPIFLCSTVDLFIFWMYALEEQNLKLSNVVGVVNPVRGHLFPLLCPTWDQLNKDVFL